MKPGAAASRFLEIAREQGARTLWFKVLGELCYRRLGLFELPLGDPPSAHRASVRLTLGPYVAERDSEEYARLSPYSDHSRTGERLGSGHVLFVARTGEGLVGACWVARGRLWSSYLQREIALAADEALTYETYTSASARGQGIGPALRAWVARELAADGIGRLLATVDPENGPAIRLVEKLGYRRIGTLGYIGARPWRHGFVRVREGARAPGS